MVEKIVHARMMKEACGMLRTIVGDTMRTDGEVMSLMACLFSLSDDVLCALPHAKHIGAIPQWRKWAADIIAGAAECDPAEVVGNEEGEART